MIPELEKLLNERMHIQRTGVLHVASSNEQVNELEKLLTIAGEFNQPAKYVSADDITEMVPWLNPDEIAKAGFIPSEAYCDPYLLGTFFAKAAALLGAEMKQELR